MAYTQSWFLLKRFVFLKVIHQMLRDEFNICSNRLSRLGSLFWLAIQGIVRYIVLDSSQIKLLLTYNIFKIPFVLQFSLPLLGLVQWWLSSVWFLESRVRIQINTSSILLIMRHAQRWRNLIIDTPITDNLPPFYCHRAFWIILY